MPTTDKELLRLVMDDHRQDGERRDYGERLVRANRVFWDSVRSGETATVADCRWEAILKGYDGCEDKK